MNYTFLLWTCLLPVGVIGGENGDSNGGLVILGAPEDLRMPDPHAPPLEKAQQSSPLPPQVEDTSQWDIEEEVDSVPADVERVGEWEAVALPPPPTEDENDQQVEEGGGIVEGIQRGSMARRELEELLIATGELTGEPAPENEPSPSDTTIFVQDIVIFNTDDFDDTRSDVEDDAPPRASKYVAA